MPGRRKYKLAAIAVIALVLMTCAGLPVVVWMGLIRRDQYSDQYATVGEYFNPMTLVNVHESSDHYIRVDGKTYSWHNGVTPGYFIVPELNAMFFQTRKGGGDGPAKIHMRDLTTGVVTDIETGGGRLFLVDQASCGVCPDRWWIHARDGSRVTFGLYNKWPGDATFRGGAMLQFTTIDLAARKVVGVQQYSYDANGGREDSSGKSIPTPPGTSAEDLIGEHRAQAGLPPLPPKP